MVDKRFIVSLQGKDFVTYEGLLDTAHKMGLQGIKTELVELPSGDNGNRCIMKATAFTDKGQYEGYGDADSTNVNRMIARHIIRMAETRAKTRALRDLTNIGMTAIEELGGDDEPKEDLKTVIKSKYEVVVNKGLRKDWKLEEFDSWYEDQKKKFKDNQINGFLTKILKGA